MCLKSCVNNKKHTIPQLKNTHYNRNIVFMMKNDLLHNLGRRIALLRKARSMSQESFAEVSGKMVNTISNIERGLSDPKTTTLKAIANALGVEISVLFENLDKKNIEKLPNSLDKLITLLKTEDEKTIKTILKQSEALLEMNKN